MKGLVIKNTGSTYQARTEDGNLYECKIRGNFRIKDIRTTNPVAVGDWVDFETRPDGAALITTIYERKNYIIRRSSNLSKQAHILAANLDLVALIVTVNYPETSLVFIDRFLATAEAYRVSACLIVNKTDLYSSDENEYLDALENLYTSLDYPVFRVSAVATEANKELVAFLKNKITLFSGNSGVGKSSLINQLCPETKARVGEISMYHNKGMHTTTFSEMFAIPDGGFIIDTPGIKGFGTVDMDHTEISHYFKEIFRFSEKCRFDDCTHVHEPGCAVLKAVEKNYISHSRYQSYLSMLADEKEGKYR